MGKKNAVKKRVIVSFSILIILVSVFYFITNSITKYTGFSIYEHKNQCLKEKEIIVYINSEDSLSTINKLSSKKYLEHFKIFNCVNNRERCFDESIRSFPTFSINDEKFYGDISEKELLRLSKC